MLRERLITAVVLLLILAVLLALEQSVYFAIFCVIASGLTLAEWWRISMDTRYQMAAYAVAAGLTLLAIYVTLKLPTGVADSAPLTASLLFQLGFIFSVISAFIWLVIVPFVLARAQTDRKAQPVFHSLFGLFTVAATALALVFFVQYLGSWFVLSYFILIWCADSFAYFGGRYFGGPKLAPAISPGKTRSGAICGIAAATIWLVLSAYVSPSSFGGILLQQSNLFVVVLSACVLSIYSIMGDLYESLMKRRAGLKDSSRILPGHGGVWDRLDSALVVTPLTFLLIYLFQA